MTVQANIQGRTAPIRIKLSTTNPTAIYTCPAAHIARVMWFSLANIDLVNAVDVTVTLVDVAAVSYTLLPTTSLPKGEVMEFDLDGHPLQATESIRVQASSVDDIHVLGVAVETPQFKS